MSDPAEQSKRVSCERENAARLWTELASEYKREKVRIENLPSGIYSQEFEIRFPFMQQMWFLEIENTSANSNTTSSELKEADSNNLEEAICAYSLATFQKRRRENEASIESSLTAPMEHLSNSIDRLISVIDRSSAEERAAHSAPSQHSDLVDHLIAFFDNVPRDKHLDYKCKIVKFLETLGSS
uniref:MADF domain-containing protein n=2 Tax=Caenorhabditis japonica TaxID=281687 RepID=A0A8R1I3W8_CAEJA